MKNGKRRSTSYNRPGPSKFAYGARTLANVAIQRAYKSYKKTDTARSSSSNGKGISYQHDSKLVWKKPAYNKRKGRAFKKFARKVHKVEASDLGKRTLIINGIITAGNTTGYNPATQLNQGFCEVNLYSCNGLDTLNSSHDKDFILNEVTNSRQGIVNTSGVSPMTVGLDTNYTGDFERRRLSPRMQGARIDITWTNDSSTALECDLYVIKHQNVRENLAEIKTFIGDAVNEGDAAAYANTLQYETISGVFGTGVVGSPFARPKLINRGVTPFDLPDKANYGMKILSKTKFFLAAKNSITRQFTDTRKIKLKPHNSDHHYRYDKDTTTYLMVYKVTDSDFIGSAYLSTKYTKKYSWTQEDIKTNAIGYKLEV